MSEVRISHPVPKQEKVFAMCWLSCCCVFEIWGLINDGFAVQRFALFSFFFICGCWLFHKTIWSVVDEVWDYDDYLRVIDGDLVLDIQLSEIIEISHPFNNHKHLICVKTKPNKWKRSRITFRATKGYPLFRSPHIYKKLLERTNVA